MTTPTNRTTKRTKTEKLLGALRSGYAIGTACATAGIARDTYYRWREVDPDFAALADDALMYGTDILEDVAFQRAVLASDTLLIFLLKSRRPDKYRETTKVEVEGEIGVALVRKG